MRSTVRTVLICLVVSLGVIVSAEKSWAGFVSGGSRLIYYYSQRSIVNPSAGTGTAGTILAVKNNSSDATKVQMKIFNGSTCTGFGPVTFDLPGNQSLRINVSDHVSATPFPEGWVDLYAVNAGGTPIRWDYLTGKFTVLDFGGTSTTVGISEAVAIFSDANRTSDPQGGLIIDHTSVRTFAPLGHGVDFWAPGGPFNIGDRLVVVPVSQVPGTAPVASTGGIALSFKTLAGVETLNTPAAPSCMLASSLSNLHASFSTSYPNATAITDGGNLGIIADLSGTNKGNAGWLFESATSPPLLGVHSLQAWLELAVDAHE